MSLVSNNVPSKAKSGGTAEVQRRYSGGTAEERPRNNGMKRDKEWRQWRIGMENREEFHVTCDAYPRTQSPIKQNIVISVWWFKYFQANVSIKPSRTPYCSRVFTLCKTALYAPTNTIDFNISQKKHPKSFVVSKNLCTFALYKT